MKNEGDVLVKQLVKFSTFGQLSDFLYMMVVASPFQLACFIYILYIISFVYHTLGG